MKIYPFHKIREVERDDKMDKKNEELVNSGSVYEGKDQVYLDIDRMINEGMSGGSVHSRHDTTNIEEARDLVKEEPPYECT
jgi:hypothetical protein